MSKHKYKRKADLDALLDCVAVTMLVIVGGFLLVGALMLGVWAMGR